MLFEEVLDGLGIGFAHFHEAVVVVAGHFEKLAGFGGGFVEALAEAVGHEVVVGAVGDEDGAFDILQAVDGRIFFTRHEANGQPGIYFRAHVGQAGEGRFENECGGLVLLAQVRGQPGGHRSAQGPSEEDNLLLRYLAVHGEVIPGGVGIAVKPGFV